MSIGPLGTNLSEILIKIQYFSFSKMHLKVSSAKWRPFCPGEDELTHLWPSDTIWRQRSGSTLAQAMACCLTAPSHYLNQCWLIISKVQWHSSECTSTRDASAISHRNYLENYLLNFCSNLPGANELMQWVPGCSFANAVGIIARGCLLSGIQSAPGTVNHFPNALIFAPSSSRNGLTKCLQ